MELSNLAASLAVTLAPKSASVRPKPEAFAVGLDDAALIAEFERIVGLPVPEGKDATAHAAAVTRWVKTPGIGDRVLAAVNRQLAAQTESDAPSAS